ncbi:MAG: 4a-hydroxytetrahydrobiopterin dehydratase [Alphaproteobacteria bacterium]|nr:4a-hydroxytetrahydrobiopterin dehydratase [Alphaproteobacteria bacterium]MCB9792400.1 4a-hydroxytetrahydrobiopterin dehydratase [Alphaproteobacteria bacterium]
MTSDLLPCKHPQQLVLESEDLQARVAGLEGWRLDEGMLVRELHFEETADAVAYIARVAEASEALNHHPRLRWFKRDVVLRLFTRKSGGITARDFELAQACDAALG